MSELAYRVLTCIASALTVVWIIVWPEDRAADLAGVRWLLVRWGHAATWGLLTVTCAGRAAPLGGRLRSLTDAAGVVALLTYVGFLLAAYVLR